MTEYCRVLGVKKSRKKAPKNKKEGMKVAYHIL